jgi:hypothetical protein
LAGGGVQWMRSRDERRDDRCPALRFRRTRCARCSPREKTRQVARDANDALLRWRCSGPSWDRFKTEGRSRRKASSYVRSVPWASWKGSPDQATAPLDDGSTEVAVAERVAKRGQRKTGGSTGSLSARWCSLLISMPQLPP